jgi:hypothetical protein
MDIVVQPYKLLVSLTTVIAQFSILTHLTLRHPARLLRKNYIFGVNQTKSSILAIAFFLLVLMSIYSIAAIVLSYENGHIVSLADALGRSDILLKMAEVFTESAHMSLIFYITSFLLPIALATEFAGTAERDASSIKFLLIYSVSRVFFYPLILFYYREYVSLGVYFIEILSVAELSLVAVIYTVVLRRVSRLKRLLSNLRLFDRYETELLLDDTRLVVSNLMLYILLELITRIFYMVILFSPHSLTYSILADLVLLARLISFMWLYKCVVDVVFYSSTSNDIYIQKMDYIMRYLEHSLDKFVLRDSRAGQIEQPS